jgi:hypothetical protein
MNTGPADTHSSHLDLEDLIAEVTGQTVDGRVREHLASCEQCRTEANRWDLVADGIRGLTAETPEAAQRARPRHLRPRVLAGPGRRTMLAASAAAALVVVGSAGYWASGFIHISFGTPGTGAKTVLTAVGGCAALEQASGTLERVNGSSLFIQTASGQPVTVTTTAATKAAESGASGALRGDIKDGASVTVAGSSSNGTIAAVLVVIANPARTHPKSAAGMVAVKGTVSDASTSGFTVVTSTGTRIPVTVSGDTVVTVTNSSLGQLPAGATVVAIGYAGPDRTLSARGLVAILQLPPGNPQLNVQAHLHVNNCSPASIDNALAFGG